MRWHLHSPIVFEGCSDEQKVYIGGLKEFVSLVEQRYKVTSNNNECLKL